MQIAAALIQRTAIAASDRLRHLEVQDGLAALLGRLMAAKRLPASQSKAGSDDKLAMDLSGHIRPVRLTCITGHDKAETSPAMCGLELASAAKGPPGTPPVPFRFGDAGLPFSTLFALPSAE